MNPFAYVLCLLQVFAGYVFYVGGNIPLAIAFYVAALVMSIDAAADRIARELRLRA